MKIRLLVILTHWSKTAKHCFQVHSQRHLVESEVEGKADAEDTVYRTGIFSFIFLTAFPPLKLTTFKVLLALKSLRGGIMATNESGIDSCSQAFEHFWANYLLVGK